MQSSPAPGEDVRLEGIHVHVDAYAALRADPAHAGCGRLPRLVAVPAPAQQYSLQFEVGDVIPNKIRDVESPVRLSLSFNDMNRNLPCLHFKEDPSMLCCYAAKTTPLYRSTLLSPSLPRQKLLQGKV